MSQEAIMVNDVVKDTSLFWPILGTALGTAGVFLAGLVPLLQYRDSKQKEKQAEKEAAIAEEEKSKPVFVEQRSFDEFERLNEVNYKNLNDTVKTTVQDVKSASQSIQVLATDIRRDQEGHARELRETLAMFQTGISTSLGQVHEKANGAVKDASNALTIVESFDSRLKAAENQLKAM